MPPKSSASGSGKKTAELVDSDIPTMNPEVLFYLQASSRAFPRVESKLVQYAQQCDAKEKIIHTELDETTVKLDKAVKKFSSERKTLEQHFENLKRNLKDTEDKIVKGAQQYEETFVTEKVKGDDEMACLQAEVDALRKDADEAADWCMMMQRKKRELRGLRESIAQSKARQEEDIKGLREEAEIQKRKLRDSLVRKLRRARDQLTSTTDDELTGKAQQGIDDLHLLALGNSAVPSAKQNEKLAREVTMYERDCEGVRQQNKVVAQDEESLQVALKNERAGNSVLVLRNASHVKARRILQQQLKDVQEQFVGAMDRHQLQHIDRLTAFRDTVASQSTLVDDLQSELEIHLRDYEEVMKKVRQIQREASQQDADARLASSFLDDCRQELRKEGDERFSLKEIDRLISYLI